MVCSRCGILEYISKNGIRQGWRTDREGNRVCRHCYNLYGRDYAKERPRQRKRMLRRLYTYKGKVMYIKQKDPVKRTGVCKQCGASGVTTNLHHYGEYIDSDPFANTIELCRKCHCKETWKLGQYDTDGYKNRPTPIIKRDPKTGRILGTLKH